MTFCTSSTVDEMKARIRKSLQFLELYQWLLDAYVVDFFIEKHWSKLNKKWQDFLENLTPEQLSVWMDGNSKFQSLQVPPLELVAMRSLIKQLSLNRNPVSNPKEFTPLLKKGLSHEDLESRWLSFEEEFASNKHHCSSLKHVFRKHVKPKKQHEIVRMAELCKSFATSTSCDKVIDIGSGVGHLSRLLGYKHKLNVVCVDTEEGFTKSAVKFDQDLAKASRKQSIDEQDIGKPPQHLTFTVDKSFDPDKFEKLLKEKWNDEKEVEKFGFGVIGLHTCGDLGPLLIRLFAMSQSSQFLLSVGCCYMKLKDFYPMSHFVKNQSNFRFSYTALELSCHAVEVYRQRLKEEDYGRLKVHCYRALLECMMQEKNPDLKHKGLKTVAKAHLLPFETYVRRATDKLGLTWSTEELNSEHVQDQLSKWWRVVVLYSLRLSLAPVIESVILLDRALYLYEQGIDAALLPVFEPDQSPRNHVLAAIRK